MTPAETPAEAAEGAGAVVTMVADAGAVEAVLGDDVFEAMGSHDPRPSAAAAPPPWPGLWLQVSTVGGAGVDRLGRLAAEAGVVYVDAPVLGTKEPAEQGRLLVLASGPEQVRGRCAPVFEAVGSQTLWLGPAGAANRLKLVLNSWIVGLVGALAETVTFAQRTGVDPQRSST